MRTILYWMLEPAAAVPVEESFSLGALNARLGALTLVIDAICSAVDFIAGVYLLQLRAWARVTIEANAWIYILVGTLCPMLNCIYTIFFTSAFADLSTTAIMPGLLVFGLGCAWRGVVNGLIICFLRSQKVRDAFASPSQAAV